MRHSVKTQILQDVLNYLANRPYHEVAAIVTAIQSDAVVIAGVNEKETTVSSDNVVSENQAAS